MLASLRNEDDKLICRAVLRNDEDEIQRIVSNVAPIVGSSTSTLGNQNVIARRSNVYEDSKQASSSQGSYNYAGSKGPLLNSNKELSIIGKEILANNPVNGSNN